jgi:chromosome segregation ATPase
MSDDHLTNVEYNADLHAKVAQLEAERSELARVYAEKVIPEWRERVAQLEAERDRLTEERDWAWKRVDVARAEVERLRAALRAWADWFDAGYGGTQVGKLRADTRRALSNQEEER